MKEKPKVNEICWLIKKEEKLTNAIGFLRNHQNGCFIIGGPTGSHYSAHNENWQEKWENYIQLNYLPQSIAIKNNIIDEDWQPPQINNEDQSIISKIKSGLL